MGRKKQVDQTNAQPKRIHRAIDPEAREKQLIALSYNVVEQRLLDGTATSQETCHFLKLGSMQNQLEMEKLRNENALLRKKVEAIDSQMASNERLNEVLDALKMCSGVSDE